jgi:hypothetical protein
MANRDLLRRIATSQSLAPAARVTGTFTGTGVDLRGFDAAVIVVAFGAYTDGTHTPSLQHSMDNATFTACAASDMDGSFSAVSSSAGANTTQSLGYIGTQRYVRVVMTTTGATTGAVSVASVIAGYPRNIPTV